MILLSMKVAAAATALAMSSTTTPQQPPPSPSPPPVGLKWLPSVTVARQLFVTGATIGPFMDGIHNQCLLQYQFVPIIMDVPKWLTAASTTTSVTTATTVTAAASLHNSYYEHHLYMSSWIIPPLLGITYIILGGVLPRIVQNSITTIVETLTTTVRNNNTDTTGSTTVDNDTPTTKTVPRKVKPPSSFVLGCKAVLAIVSTAMILSLSQYSILHPNERGMMFDTTVSVFESSDSLEQHLLILLTAAITQWAYLDGTVVALLTATMTSVLGPLAELPFISHHLWEYLSDAGDIYVPLQHIDVTTIPGQFLQRSLGDEYSTLALNGVTGPCYFAVTMDAIAIGRFLDSMDTSSSSTPETTDFSSGRNRNGVIAATDENRLFIASSRDHQHEQQSQSTTQSDSDLPIQ